MNEHATHLVILGVSAMIVAICVMLHYEALRFLGRTLGAHVHKRIGVLLVMMGLLIANFSGGEGFRYCLDVCGA